MDTAVLQITNKCPFDCPQCYMLKGNQNMDFAIAVEAIRKAKSLGAKAIQFTGGEPMCYPYLNEIVSFCAQQELYSIVATSGYGCSLYRYKHLADSGLTAVCISLNSLLEKTNEQTRDGYAFAMSAIDCAIKSGLLCFVNLVLTKETVASLRKTVELLKEKGVVGVELLKRLPNYLGEIPKGLTSNQLSIVNDVQQSNKDFVRVEKCCFEYWKKYGDKKEISCADAGRKCVFWNVDGFVSPCSKQMNCKFSSVEEMLQNKDKWGDLCY